MGYDAIKKSEQSERKQRLIIVISLVAISAAFFVVTSLLSPPRVATNINPPWVGNEDVDTRNADKIATKQQQTGGGAVRGALDHKDTSIHVDHTPQIQKQVMEKEAATLRADLEAQVRAIKKTGVIMEADEKSLELTGKLQEATRSLIRLRYGNYSTQNYRIKFELEFQSTIPDFEEKGKDGTLTIELAPISLIPCSVYNFLEIARTWKKGAFHRNAGHVLQAMARSDITQSMPFQEYSKEYPHKKGTLGYAGRPSGPEFYVSTQDNAKNHGPGSQQKHNPYEADCIIGTVIQGMEDGTVARIHTMPGKEFIGDKKKWVLIRRMHILVPSGDGPDGYTEFSSSPKEIPQD